MVKAYFKGIDVARANHPLSRHGSTAHSWSQQKREQFANYLPSLINVSLTFNFFIQKLSMDLIFIPASPPNPLLLSAYIYGACAWSCAQ